jgi:nitroimidazol reductase NimA-like FMN-containing flavoprotein (pyridoxamine 5'-phosphate oxidase superfamily)
MPDDISQPSPLSNRTTVRRGAKRAEYGVSQMREVLKAGTVAHVAVNTDEGPLVLPMVYGISEDTLYLHGALANSLLKAGADHQICATITILDGLVFAKSPFSHSMNYRSVVVRGQARVVSDAQETLRALQLMTDHVVPSWDVTRPLNDSEIRATRVIALPLTEMSAKIRKGGAINDPEDAGVPYWAGHIPLTTVFGEPVPNEDAVGPMPPSISTLPGRDIHAPRR